VLKPGYEPTPVQVNVQSATVTKDRAIHLDWASSDGGASIISFTPPDYTGAGCGPQGAIDLVDGSGWGSDSVTNHESGFGGPRHITIRLPHAVDIARFGVDPSPVCGDGSSAALKTFKIEVKTASGPFHIARGTTTAGPLGHITTFAPTGPANNVIQVRFTMLSNRGDHNFMDMTELTVHGSAS